MTEIISVNVADRPVGFHVGKKELGDFISGLLGQPQSLERKIEAPFSVDHQWLIHFFSMIQQRIQQQNSPENLAFETSINYREGTERKLNSWESFEHFTETMNIISTGVKFHLSFLIQFNGKKVPERQEIIINFDSNESQSSIMDGFFGRGNTVGEITIEIRHTERTWADDLFRIIENEISTINVNESTIKKNLRKIFLPFASLSFPLMMFGSVIYSTWSKRGDGEIISNKISSIPNIGSYDLISLHSKVDILISEAQGKASNQFAELSLFLYLIVFAGLMFLGSVFLARPAPSFVVLSAAAKANKIKTLEKLKRKNLWLVGSIVFTFILGIFGNYVYDKISQYLL